MHKFKMTIFESLFCFVIIICIFIQLIIHELKFDKRRGVYKKGSLKELLFPSVLPFHVSPPLYSKIPKDNLSENIIPNIYI